MSAPINDGGEPLNRLLDDLVMSLADDMEIAMACVRDVERTNSAAAISAMLNAQQRLIRICNHVGHTPRRKLTGLLELSNTPMIAARIPSLPIGGAK